MKYKEGDKVRVRSLEWYNENKDRYDLSDCISCLCGKIVIIEKVTTDYYLITYGWWVKEEVLEELENNEQTFKAIDDVDYVKPVVFENIIFPNENYADKVELCLGNDYEIVVEDGRTFVQKKKPKYPKSFQECYYLLYGQQDLTFGCDIMKGAYGNTLECLQMLLICREVYWRIAGDWKPKFGDNFIYAIGVCYGVVEKVMVSGGRGILLFPTEEMRDAFYENFKDLIESCKELL